MKKKLILLSLITLFLNARSELAVSVDSGMSGLSSNSVIDIDHVATSIWLGTGSGASLTNDDGATWTTFGSDPWPSDEISALAANNKGVWVGNSHSQSAAGSTYP